MHHRNRARVDAAPIRTAPPTPLELQATAEAGGDTIEPVAPRRAGDPELALKFGPRIIAGKQHNNVPENA